MSIYLDIMTRKIALVSKVFPHIHLEPCVAQTEHTSQPMCQPWREKTVDTSLFFPWLTTCCFWQNLISRLQWLSVTLLLQCCTFGASKIVRCFALYWRCLSFSGSCHLHSQCLAQVMKHSWFTCKFSGYLLQELMNNGVFKTYGPQEEMKVRLFQLGWFHYRHYYWLRMATSIIRSHFIGQG